MYSRLFRRHLKRSRRRLIRYSLLTANLALLLGVIWFVRASGTAGGPSSQSALIGDGSKVSANPLDQLSSADIAVHVARMTRLDEATAVTNQADTVNAQLAFTPADDTIVAKPQVVSTAIKSRDDIATYVANEGDTVTSIAKAHGVSSDSIRHSNGLTGDRVAVGSAYSIPPVNGLVYIVKAGDTPESIAQRFTGNKDQIIKDNDAEIRGLVVGEKILIRDGIQPVARATSFGYGSGFAWGGANPIYNSNGYDYGWCTWHAANRRRETGRPVPSNLGNAISWYSLAQRAGLATGTTPAAGAVVWHANMGGLGHVAFVESINEDGSAVVSDMNYPSWGRVTTRIVTPGEFGNYRFIY